MPKDRWWVRHRTIGFICGMVVLFFAFMLLGIFGFFEQVWMYFKGYDYVPGWGKYVHRKTGERK